jgi:hypothetical protein
MQPLIDMTPARWRQAQLAKCGLPGRWLCRLLERPGHNRFVVLQRLLEVRRYRLARRAWVLHILDGQKDVINRSSYKILSLEVAHCLTADLHVIELLKRDMRASILPRA